MSKIFICLIFYIRLLFKFPFYHKVKINLKTGDKIVLLNTEYKTNNLGDCIIMSSCHEILNDLFPDEEFIEVATHIPASNNEILVMQHAKVVIICGTNFLSSKMELHSVWKYSEEMITIPNIVLLGVGGDMDDFPHIPNSFIRLY